MILTEQDIHAATWMRIKKHLEDRLAKLRAQNDSVALDHEATAHLRGQISEVKYLLALDKAEPHIPD